MFDREYSPALVYCWTNVIDGGPTVNQRWANASCLLGIEDGTSSWNMERSPSTGSTLWHLRRDVQSVKNNAVNFLVKKYHGTFNDQLSHLFVNPVIYIDLLYIAISYCMLLILSQLASSIITKGSRAIIGWKLGGGGGKKGSADHQTAAELDFWRTFENWLLNPWSAEIFFYTPWKPKGYFQFESILNVLVCFFWFIWMPMLWVYGSYKYVYSYSAGIVIRRQHLTSTDVRFWRLKLIPAL